MGLQAPPLGKWFRICSLLLVLGAGIALGEVGADNHETQQLVKITGTVVDNDTEVPVAAVSIRVADTKIQTQQQMRQVRFRWNYQAAPIRFTQARHFIILMSLPMFR